MTCCAFVWDGGLRQMLCRYYCLLMWLESDKTLTVGKLGTYRFVKGYYTYVGRAKRNIEARISRHMSRTKKKRWHIDYLTAMAVPVEVKLFTSEDVGSECELARKIEALGGKIIARGFGSSDCGCPSHLHYFSQKPVI